MGFLSYEGIDDSILDEQHSTSTGEIYTLRHNENLKVEMSYLGKGNSAANAQGWERNSKKYFDQLYQKHPEMFSKKNIMRLKFDQVPIVDQTMIASNPGWEKFRNQPLVHHHIGGDGEAVALPKNAHKGHGEIHNIEKSAGITEACKSFSQKCSAQQDAIGKTSGELHTKFHALQNQNQNKSELLSGNKKTETAKFAKVSSNNTLKSRARSVRNAIPAQNRSVASCRSSAVGNLKESVIGNSSSRPTAKGVSRRK